MTVRELRDALDSLCRDGHDLEPVVISATARDGRASYEDAETEPVEIARFAGSCVDGGTRMVYIETRFDVSFGGEVGEGMTP